MFWAWIGGVMETTVKVEQKATYQDVLDAAEHLVAEILDGELFTSPRPAAPHARASSALGASLMVPFDLDKGGGGDEPDG